MAKYALLLKEIVRVCSQIKLVLTEEMLEDYEQLEKAESMIRYQLKHGNDLLAMDSIRDCDLNLNEQGLLFRQNEFIVSEGKSNRKHRRQVFLFEDLVLFSKPKRYPDKKVRFIEKLQTNPKTDDMLLVNVKLLTIGNNDYKRKLNFLRHRDPTL